MNKKLVALAVAGLLGAPLLAQAQTASVVLYGSVRGALVSTKVSGGNNAIAEASHSSRFGIRANESIGDGLSGFAHLEVGYAADLVTGDNVKPGTATISASGNNFQIRESWVGLSGGFGEVKLGSGLNVYDDVMGMNHNSLVAGYNNINNFYFGGGSSAAAFSNYNYCIGTAFDGRYGNSVRYASPQLGPVQFKSQYAIGNETASGRKCGAFDNAVFATFGPAQVGLVYAQHLHYQAAPSVLDHNAGVLSGTAKASFGMIDVNVGLESAKYTANWNASSAKYRAYALGAGVNFGPTKVGLDFTGRDNGIGASGSGLHNALVVQNALGGGKLATLYVNHNFSKRTLGYLWFSQDKPETGAKSTQMAVALRHNY